MRNSAHSFTFKQGDMSKIIQVADLRTGPARFGYGGPFN
eukprot:COSAG04_NODE_26049_length_300_cov_0.766169_1_plen_38_part_01